MTPEAAAVIAATINYGIEVAVQVPDKLNNLLMPVSPEGVFCVAHTINSYVEDGAVVLNGLLI